MNNHVEIPYWITLAHMPRWGPEKINRLIVKIVHDNLLNIEEFFNLSETDFRTKYGLSEKDIFEINMAKKELPNTSFLAEDLLSQGFEVIPINSPAYSNTLKNNLKLKHAPPLLYVKGNKKILNEDSIAIVGSRDPSEISLRFTDNIARLASKQYKVVVSGFAKGVDKQALDSALKYKGHSIIVLPQGIMTFTSGFRKYYKPIVEGDVLVLSTFHPKAVWSTGLAMARNSVIYGLAKEIYVAQSNEKGGTWEGVINGLKKGRAIYVRMPEKDEKNANPLLIEKGAHPVDFNGKVIEIKEEKQVTSVQHSGMEIEKGLNLNEKIIDALRERAHTAKELVGILQIDWKPQKLLKYLKTMKELESVENTRPKLFRIKSEKRQKALF